MSFRKIVVAIVLTGLFLTLSGCSGSVQGTANNENNYNKYDPARNEQIKNAKTAFDLKQYFTLSTDNVLYNEYPGAAEDFAMYFSLIDTGSYVVVDSDNEKYILFQYEYSEYDEILASISGMKKTYKKQNNCVLEVNVDYEITRNENDGCYPSISVAYCILKLEEDIDELLVDDYEYKKFDGGLIYVNQRYGVVNEDYDIIVPIEYFGIRDLETFGEETKKYIFVRNEDGVGLMDENYNILIQPSYVNLEYVSNNKFIVQKDADGDMNTFEDYQLSMIDEDENELFGHIDGYLVFQNTFDNPLHQIIIGRIEDDKMYEGVIDDQLNVIIDTIYTDVADFGISDNHGFYVVEREEGETAVIDFLGKQQTEFKKASVYDTQTAYYEKIGR